MKWMRAKGPNDYPVGHRRTTTRFAWWPTDVGDYVVWLESYVQVEEVFRMSATYSFSHYWYVTERRLLPG